MTSPSERDASTPARRDAWLRTPERGTAFGIKALLAAHRVFGRGFAVAILHVVAFYYALFASGPRKASRAYLERVRGAAPTDVPEPDAALPRRTASKTERARESAGRRDQKPGFFDVVRHIATFAVCSFDRVLLAAGRLDGFTIERDGNQHLAALAAARRGAILLGAHVGSFEALRAMGEREQLVVNVLVHFRNARKITEMLRAVAPDFDARVIEIDPDAPHHVLAVRERIEAGELVAVLGDRVGLGEGTATVDFLGGKVALPTGPYALAAVLRCPIYLTFGLYMGRGRYALSCEPFVESVDLSRSGRKERLAELAQRYATRLEAVVRKAPYCWFNFYDLWS